MTSSVKTKTTYGKSFRLILTLVKHWSLLILALTIPRVTNSTLAFIVVFLEILAVFALSQLVLSWSRICGYIVSTLLCLLLGVQLLSLKFANTYLSLIMVTNLYNVRDLTGGVSTYIPWIAPFVLVSFFPVASVFPSGFKRWCVGAYLAVFLVFLFIVKGNNSPLYAYITLAEGWHQYTQLTGSKGDVAANRLLFYRFDIPDAIERPSELPSHPNVILIFTEGLSRHILYDERNVMPNVAYWESQSLHFSNYYNHTFATFRGLIGQLYSGYQLNDTDENTLISLQSILKDVGYRTTFINTEPNHEVFTEYLNSLGFDEVRGEPGGNYEGEVDSLSDREAYEILRQTVEEQHSQDEPFFISIYTFGTHASLNAVDHVFGDGKDSVLNKFYDLDCQFGAFMDWFTQSEAIEDTLLVFTTDHATYADSFYASAFPTIDRAFVDLDEIPLFFYYPGISMKEIDVDGRNTLDLAPTILDYLDISAPNYFLGTTLFDWEKCPYDTVYHSITSYISSAHGEQRMLSFEEAAPLRDSVQKYFSAKIGSSGDALYTDSLAALDYSAELSDDGSTLKVTVPLNKSYDNVWLPTWSEADGQDDIVWYQAEYDTSVGKWICLIDLSNHRGAGELVIHFYTEHDGQNDFICATSLYFGNKEAIPAA